MTIPKRLKSITIALLLAAIGIAPFAMASENSRDSTIILPIQANLKVLENRLNTDIPDTLVHINERKICVNAKWGITKLPYITWEVKKIFGAKIKLPTTRTRMARTKISPEIRCQIKGWVKRNGHISVSGSGSTMRFAFPIKAQVSAKAGIRETANAAATIYVSATPRINKDWSITVDVAPDFTWSQRPTLNLFGLIEVTIGTQVESKLKEKMNEFVKNIPGILADIKLNEKVAATWSDVQNPVKISDSPELYVLFSPKGVAYSGFNIEDNILKTTLSVKGNTQVMLGKPSESRHKTELSSLGAIPYKNGEFSFSLPVFASYNEVLAIANEQFPDGYVTELKNGSVKGTLKMSNPKIQKSNDGKLMLSVGINYDNRSKWLKAIDVFDWFDIDGVLTFSGKPNIDSSTRTLALDELSYDSSTSSKLFDALVDVAGIKVVRDHLARKIVFAYGPKLDDGVSKANEALNIIAKDGVKVSASLHYVAIEDVTFTDSSLRIDTRLSGVVNASIGL